MIITNNVFLMIIPVYPHWFSIVIISFLNFQFFWGFLFSFFLVNIPLPTLIQYSYFFIFFLVFSFFTNLIFNCHSCVPHWNSIVFISFRISVFFLSIFLTIVHVYPRWCSILIRFFMVPPLYPHSYSIVL